MTIILAIIFTFFQGLEYVEASFHISDRVYGRTFFIATGFHGLHVQVGTIFLVVCTIRLIANEFSSDHHGGIEFAI
jgi:cytochrome c oxidase subunit 3